MRGLSEVSVHFDHSEIGTVSSDPVRSKNTCMLLGGLFGNADVCTCRPSDGLHPLEGYTNYLLIFLFYEVTSRI